MTDAELVAEARAGSHEAFGTLVDRHRAAVVRAAMAVTGSAAEADDVAQEAFVLAWRRLGTWREEASFKTWLLAITWRHATSRRRALWRRVRETVSGRDEAPLDPASPDPSPEQVLASGEFARTVRRLVGTLPVKVRGPMLMAASGEYTFEEMSAILGVPSGTLKWRVAEGRRRLREKLSRLGYEWV